MVTSLKSLEDKAIEIVEQLACAFEGATIGE